MIVTPSPPRKKGEGTEGRREPFMPPSTLAALATDVLVQGLAADRSASVATPTPAPFDVDDDDGGMEATMYKHLREGERTVKPYLARQPDITAKFREILVDWLAKVTQDWRLRPETLHLTVNLVDRFLFLRSIPRTDLQLVGVTALFIASKYEEIYAPDLTLNFVHITDRAYLEDRILEFEAIMLEALDYRLTTPSSLCFAHRFVKAARLDSNSPAAAIAFYMVDRALQEYTIMTGFKPSTIAAAAVHVAMRRLGMRTWSPTLAFHTGATEDDLHACGRALAKMAAEAQHNPLVAVRDHYRTAKHFNVGDLVWEGGGNDFVAWFKKVTTTT